MKAGLSRAALCLAACAGVAGCGPRPALPVRATGPGTLPTFVLLDRNERRWTHTDVTGREALLLFLCGCSPCRQLATQVQRQLPDWGGVQVLAAIYADPRTEADLLGETGLACPVLRDPFGDFRAGVGIGGCPGLVVADSSGRIRMRMEQEVRLNPGRAVRSAGEQLRILAAEAR